MKRYEQVGIRTVNDMHELIKDHSAGTAYVVDKGPCEPVDVEVPASHFQDVFDTLEKHRVICSQYRVMSVTGKFMTPGFQYHRSQETADAALSRTIEMTKLREERDRAVEALKTIDGTIRTVGAPIGSFEYFKILATCYSTLYPVKEGE